MTITYHWILTDTVRTYRNLTQAECNRLINHMSVLQETQGEVEVRITVEEDK